MTDYRGILYREAERVGLPPGALDRLLERRQRKARIRRVTAAATAFLVAGAGIWVAAVAFRARPRPTLPAVITPANVSGLQPIWAANVGAPASAPVVSQDAVYVTAGEPGGDLRLYVFPISCGPSEPCLPAWYAELGPANAPTRPAVTGEMVFATGDRLHAFPARCATEGRRCDPIWTSSPALGQYSAPLAEGDSVYVTTGGTLEVYRVSGQTGEIDASWRGPGGGGANPPAAGRGNIYAISHAEGLSAFPARCQTDNRTCRPRWRAAVASSDAPGVAASEEAVFAVAARLYAFGHDCRVPRCEPLWFSEGITSVNITPPAIGEGEVYVGGDRLYAFAAECGSESCGPAWVGPEQPDPTLPEPRSWSEPVARANMVFSSTDRPYSFPAACAAGGSVCAPLWVGPPRSGAAFTAIGVSDRIVAFSATDGIVRAFAVSATD